MSSSISSTCERTAVGQSALQYCQQYRALRLTYLNGYQRSITFVLRFVHGAVRSDRLDVDVELMNNVFSITSKAARIACANYIPFTQLRVKFKNFSGVFRKCHQFGRFRRHVNSTEQICRARSNETPSQRDDIHAQVRMHEAEGERVGTKPKLNKGYISSYVKENLQGLSSCACRARAIASANTQRANQADGRAGAAESAVSNNRPSYFRD